MPFWKKDSVEGYLFPGRPIATPIGRVVLARIGLVSDAVVVARGTRWAEVINGLPDELRSKYQLVDQGPDFVGKVIGIASTGLRVAGFSTPRDAEQFLRTVARRPFPLAAVAHAAGNVGSSAYGFGFQLSATTPQESVDFALIAQRASEDALVPGICVHRAFRDLSSVGTLLEPESEMLQTWLSDREESIETPSSAQQMLFGEMRRRVPAVVDLDRPVGIGPELTGRIATIARAGVGPFFMDAVPGLLGRIFEEFGALTGRSYASTSSSLQPHADYMVLTDGPTEVFERYGSHAALQRKKRLGIIKVTVSSPFPETDVLRLLKGCSAVTVLDTVDSRSSGQGRLATAVRTALYNTIESGSASENLHPADLPAVFEARFDGTGSPGPHDVVALVDNMLPGGVGLRRFDLGVSFAPGDIRVPSLESLYQTIRRFYPGIEGRGLSTHSVDPQSPARGRALVVAGTDIASVSAVSESFATAGFDVLRRPAATSIDRVSTPAGEAPFALASIDSVSPVAAETGAIGAIISSRSDELTRWLSDPRLTKNAVLFLPASQLPRFALSLAGKNLGQPVRVYSVEIESAVSEAHTLMALVSAWMKSDSVIANDWDAFSKGFLTALTERMSWNRDEQQRASHLLIASEGAPWSALPEDDPTSGHVPEPIAPDAVRRAVKRTGDFADAGRFWRTVGYSFATGRQDALSPDPYICSNTVPARTASFRSGSARQDRLPELYPENCTGCGACAAFCPEGAIRTATQSMEALVEYGIGQVRLLGKPTTQLDRISKPLSKKAHRLVARDELFQHRSVGEILEAALEPVLEAMNPAEETKRDLLDGFETLLSSVGTLPVIRTKTFFDTAEGEQKGSGQLFLLGINPDACTSCGLCMSACSDDAIGMRDVTDDIVARYQSVATSVANVQPEYAPPEYSGPMDYLMGRKASEAVLGSDMAYPGSGSKLTIRLVCSLIEAEQVPRFAALTEEAEDLIESVRKEINEVLHTAIDVNDFEAFGKRLDALKRQNITTPDLVDLAAGVNEETVNSERLGLLTAVLGDLESIRGELESGRSGDGRARMAAVFGSGPLLAASRPFPFNPYPFPWIHIEGGSPVPVAEGLFEGVTSKMCSMFATFRRARKLAKGLDVVDSDSNLLWTDLTSEEWTACPPICVFTEEEADIPHSWLRGRIPINIFVLDGNGALLEHGWGLRLWPLARPDWFVLHSTAAAFDHFSSGIRAGVAHRGPSIFRLYTPEPRQHGFQPEQTGARMLAAVRARAFPLLRYDPDPDVEWTDRWSLDGNESVEDDWVSKDETPSRWMLGEGRFRQQSEDAVLEATTNAGAFWRLLQELAGIRSTALAQARREAQTEIQKQVAADRATIESTAQAEIDRVTTEHTAIYHQKLRQQLLRLSGFGPGTDAYDRVLSEYTDSIESTRSTQSTQAPESV